MKNIIERIIRFLLFQVFFNFDYCLKVQNERLGTLVHLETQGKVNQLKIPLKVFLTNQVKKEKIEVWRLQMTTSLVKHILENYP